MQNHTQSSALPSALYTAEQVKALDQEAINRLAVPGIKLMKRAGRAAFEKLLEHWPDLDSLTVFCGAGNNAGDGYVVAALAAQKRIAVDIVQLADPEKLPADAHKAYQFARQEGVIMAPFQEHGGIAGEVVVDALLGIGSRGAPRGDYAAAVAQINEANKPVLALDIPSGLCADTGHAEAAVNADITVCFIGLKRGLLTARGPKHCGQLYFDGLGVADDCNSQVAEVERVSSAQLLERLPAREADAHKGRFGHVLVIGGDHGYAGAALLSAESAARCGAGLVSVATRAEHIAAIVSRRPELMAQAVVSGQELAPLLEKASVVVIGPGLGRSPWSEQLLQQAADYCAEQNLPMVMDADALNMLAEARVIEGARDNWVLTPHPGEAARLLACEISDIEQDRFASVAKLQQKYGGAVLLKGAGSLICCHQAAVGLASVGNPGMASAGMGDVLSGVIAALIAQGMSPGDACRLAVCLHGDAGDLAADEFGQRGMLAADLIPYLSELLAQV